MRVFVGAMVPEALWPAVGRLQDALGCGRAVAEENLHLTLVFAGEVAPRELDGVHEALAALRVVPLELELAGLDLLGPEARPEALVLALRPNPGLEALQAKVAAALRRAGLEIERRRFRPHVTIARFAKGVSAAQAVRVGQLLQGHGDVVLPAWRMAGFALICSHLSRDGAEYEVLADYPEL